MKNGKNQNMGTTSIGLVLSSNSKTSGLQHEMFLSRPRFWELKIHGKSLLTKIHYIRRLMMANSVQIKRTKSNGYWKPHFIRSRKWTRERERLIFFQELVNSRRWVFVFSCNYDELLVLFLSCIEILWKRDERIGIRFEDA